MLRRAAVTLLLLLAMPVVWGAHIVDFSPQGTVAVVRSIKVGFDTPVISFGDDQAGAPLQVKCNDPDVTGQGRWTDAQTWTYVFDSALAPGISCLTEPNDVFRTLQGAALSGELNWSFSTGGPAVINSLPYDTQIDEDQIFVLQFNGEIEPRSLADNAHCIIEGLGEVVPVRLITDAAQRKSIFDVNYLDNDVARTTHLLQCRRRLPAEGKVQLVLDRGVMSRSGVRSTQGRSFAYSVRPPFKATLSCQRENARAACSPLSPIRLSFSSPVPVDSAMQFRLQTGSGEPRTPTTSEWGYQNSTDGIWFDGPFDESTELTLLAPDVVTDDAGRYLSNASQFPLSVPTARYPPLVKFASEEFGAIERFSNVPAGQSENSYPPAVPLTVRGVETILPARDLALPIGMVSDYSPQDDADVLQWYARLKRLESGRWTQQQLQQIMAGEQPGDAKKGDAFRDSRDFSMLADQVSVRKLELPVAQFDETRPLEVIGVPIVEPGFHVLEVESARLGQALLEPPASMYVRTAALVTNLGVHLKQGRDDMLVWVTTLDQGDVVPHASVHVLNCSGEVLASGETDGQGVWHYPEPLDAPDYCEDTGLGGLYVSARIAADHVQARGKADFAFVLSDWNRGIEPWRFNVPTDQRPEATLVKHTVFDRTLLRAGETVSMRHYARLQTRDGLTLPDSDRLPDRLLIEHQGSDQLYELPLAWGETASGGVAATSAFSIPESARLGVYTVALVKGDEYAYPEGEFRVEEFKLPVLSGSLKISGPFGQSVLYAPQRLNADVQLSYVSGGPAGELPVTISAVMRDKSLSFPDYDDFSFSVPQTEGLVTDSNGDQEDAQILFVDKQALRLDEHGGARLSIETMPPITRVRDLLFEASFSDPNGQTQTLSQIVTAWPASVLAGIRVPDWQERGKPMPVTGIALSSTGQPYPNVKMSIQAMSRTTYSTRKRLVGGFYSYDNQTETKDLGTVCSGVTNAQGLLKCDTDLDETGSIALVATVTDEEGREASAEASVWVSGSEMWFGGHNDDRIDIIPDKKVYAPGDIAEIQVRMPFRFATALVTIEREGVLDTEVVQLSGNDPLIKVPIRADWGPNVYVSVLVLRGRLRDVPWYSFLTWGWRQPATWLDEFRRDEGPYIAPSSLVDLSKPAFRFGLTELRVSSQQDQLVVHVDADRSRYQVREMVDVTLQVSLPDGTPAAHASVAFAAVDQALIELMPNESWDLLDAMRQRRSYGVSTATSQMQVVGRRHFGRKALPAGGGGGKSPTRELLDTLLLWQPSVQLDAQGKARITVPLNDAITSFKLVAVADYGSDRFGTGSATIVTTQDLQIISGLPMLVRSGDRYEASFSVRNTTAREIEVDVTARYDGKGGLERTLPAQRLKLAAGRAQPVSWDIEVPQGLDLARSTRVQWRIDAHEVSPDRSADVADESRSMTLFGAAEPTEQIALVSDSLAISQVVIPAVPVRVRQSTLRALAADEPINLRVAPPVGALTSPAGLPRGGLDVHLQASLAAGLPGVVQWFNDYRYTCLEQVASKAIGMGSTEQWAKLMRTLPDYLDQDGLASYFPGASRGNEVLTAYLVSASHEAADVGLHFPIPARTLDRMQQGLLAFAQGQIVRTRWSPQADLDVRKLIVFDALSRLGLFTVRMLDTISINPNGWPTSAVIDWLALLQRAESIPSRDDRIQQARQVLLGRMLSRGTELVFADDSQNNWWWLMSSPEVNAAKLILTVASRPEWTDEVPRMAYGLLQRQRNGAWRTTTENLLGSLAIQKFAQIYENEPLTGTTQVSLESVLTSQSFEWDDAGPDGGHGQGDAAGNTMTYFQPWQTTTPEALDIVHRGSGNGWALVRSLAAVPVTTPIMAGYHITREIMPVVQAQAGGWTRGDIYRVRLRITAQTASVWAVVNDPIPAGATILGSGLGRDSAIASTVHDDSHDFEPSFVERSSEGYRAYYAYLPEGETYVQYTVRLNTAGEFTMPATRIEAMYQPDMYGVFPNIGLTVRP